MTNGSYIKVLRIFSDLLINPLVDLIVGVVAGPVDGTGDAFSFPSSGNCSLLVVD